jgi:uncharacterized protein YjiS (DUF1127 family)
MTIFKKMSRLLQKRSEYKHAVEQLSRMSDRELSDIGISRADIHDVVRQDMARKSTR